MIRVMGFDVALAKTGVGAPDGATYLIRTKPTEDRGHRLHGLRLATRYYLRTQRVDLAVVELVPPMIRSVDTAVALGMAQGVVREVLAEYDIPTADVTNSTLKLFGCGKGNADKREMVAAANRHRQTSPEAQPITDDNEADAWWLRAMGLWHCGERIALETCDEFLHGDDVRERACHGPWKTRGGPGAKWPGPTAGTAAPR